MMRRLSTVLLLAVLFATGASAYYHFLHYGSRTGPFQAIPEKFDLKRLINNTVTYYISEAGAAQLAAGDSMTAVVGQLRAAARSWNEIDTSEIRLAFGGLFAPGTPQNTPVIEVIFEDLPPGVVGFGGPTHRAEAQSNGSPFLPITRSVVVLQRNLTQRPSHSERFFLTAVHEFGHALGLQHSWASSAMSTEATRATTKARPLSTDDIAGISVLYPAPRFQSETGSIVGRVAMNGQGVALASVVALPPNGPAVSALTHPDGTYRIDGVPAGAYYVYAHPLPPNALADHGIIPALYPEGDAIAAGPVFETQFYPGGRMPQQTVYVQNGAAAENIDFNVQARGPLQLYGVQTYSFPAQVPVKPAFLSVGGGRSFLVASGVGLTTGTGAPVAGLTVSVLGGSAVVQGTRAYSPGFLQLDLQVNGFSGEGPRHLLFSLNNNVYVLPSGLNVTQKQPPSVNAIASNPDPAGGSMLLLEGANLGQGTRVHFDGEPGVVRGSDEQGKLLVTPPPGPFGHRAVVTALNDDGQSSMFIQESSPPSYALEAPDLAAFSLSPQSLPAGVETVVEVMGSNLRDGYVRLGFGSSDVVVRKLWVVSPSRAIANVAVASSAAATPVTVTLTNGLQVLSQPFGFQIQPQNTRAMTIQLPSPAAASLQGAPGAASLISGGTFSFQVTNLASGATPNVTLGDRQLSLVANVNGLLTVQVPRDFVAGNAVLRVQNGSDAAFPMLVTVDPPPPMIANIVTTSNVAVDHMRPARPGDLLVAIVGGLGDPGSATAASRVQVTGGGAEHQVIQITAQPNQNVHRVTFVLSPSTSVGQPAPLVLSIDGRPSSPFLLPVQ